MKFLFILAILTLFFSSSVAHADEVPISDTLKACNRDVTKCGEAMLTEANEQRQNMFSVFTPLVGYKLGDGDFIVFHQWQISLESDKLEAVGKPDKPDATTANVKFVIHSDSPDLEKTGEPENRKTVSDTIMVFLNGKEVQKVSIDEGDESPKIEKRVQILVPDVPLITTDEVQSDRIIFHPLIVTVCSDPIRLSSCGTLTGALGRNDGSDVTVNYDVTAVSNVPEPSTSVLVVTGIIGLVASHRRRARRKGNS